MSRGKLKTHVYSWYLLEYSNKIRFQCFGFNIVQAVFLLESKVNIYCYSKHDVPRHFLFSFSAYIVPKLHGTTKQISLSLNTRTVSGFGSACFLVSWGSFPAMAFVYRFSCLSMFHHGVKICKNNTSPSETPKKGTPSRNFKP